MQLHLPSHISFKYCLGGVEGERGEGKSVYSVDPVVGCTCASRMEV